MLGAALRRNRHAPALFLTAGLCADIDKFAFLLGGSDGEHLVT